MAIVESLDTPGELLDHKLRTALGMEHGITDLLAHFDGAVPSQELRDRFRHHAWETGRHIANISGLLQDNLADESRMLRSITTAMRVAAERSVAPPA
jgi:ferritin-like metal-binding protein YciE